MEQLIVFLAKAFSFCVWLVVIGLPLSVLSLIIWPPKKNEPKVEKGYVEISLRIDIEEFKAKEELFREALTNLHRLIKSNGNHDNVKHPL